MAATVFISESNGAVEVVTDNISNMNFGNADTPNLSPASHPISQGANSYAKWWRIKLQSLGGSTQIQNMKFWKSSGAYVTGEIIGGSGNTGFVVFPGDAISTYGHNDIGSGNTPLAQMPHTGNGSAIFGGNPYSNIPLNTAQPGSFVVSASAGTSQNLNAPGQYSDYLALGMITTGATPLGPVNQKIITWQYDEF